MPNNFPALFILMISGYCLITVTIILLKSGLKKSNKDINLNLIKSIINDKSKKRKEFIYEGSFFQDRLNITKEENIPESIYNIKLEEELEKIRPQFCNLLNKFVKRYALTHKVTTSLENGRQFFKIEKIRRFVREIDLITLLDGNEKNIGDYIVEYYPKDNVLLCETAKRK